MGETLKPHGVPIKEAAQLLRRGRKPGGGRTAVYQKCSRPVSSMGSKTAR